MNFLERSAFKKIERTFAPRLAAGETILEFDIGRSAASGRQTTVVATNRSVFVGFTGLEAHAGRMGYENIAYADGSVAESLWLLGHDGKQVSLLFDRGLRGVVPVIQDRLACLDDYSVDVNLGGGTATLRYRAWRDQVISCWSVITSPAALSPDIASEPVLVAARKAAGEHVLSRSRSAPDRPVTTVGTTRDWSAPVDAWLDWCGDRSMGLVFFVQGHIVSKDGQSERRVIILTEESLHIVGFPALNFPLIRMIPHVSVPISRIADWEVREPERNGNRLVRLLVMDEGSMGYPSFEAADAHGQSLLLLLGFPPYYDESQQFIDALVERVKADGAYSPGTREFHPLQKGATNS